MRRLVGLLLACGVGCGGTSGTAPPATAPAIEQRPTVDNPTYTAWAKFSTGTAVTHRSTTTADGQPGKTVTTTVITLVAKTDAELIVETQATTERYDGSRAVNPTETFRHPRRITLPANQTADTFGQPPAGDRAEETQAVAGESYRTVRTTSKASNEAGEVIGTTWTSDDMPGRLVRSESRTPAIGKSVVIEVVEVKRPPATP